MSTTARRPPVDLPGLAALLTRRPDLAGIGYAPVLNEVSA